MKGQSALESMAGVVMLILLFIAFQFFFGARISEGELIKARASIVGTCRFVAGEIQSAAVADGYVGRLTIPLDPYGRAYQIAVYNSTVLIDAYGQSCVADFHSGPVRLNGNATPFNLTSGTFTINATGGAVDIG